MNTTIIIITAVQNLLWRLSQLSSQIIVHGDSEHDLKNYLTENNYQVKQCVVVTDPPFNIGYHYNKYEDKINETDYWNMIINTLMTFDNICIIMYPEQLYTFADRWLITDLKKVCTWVYNANTNKQHRDAAYFGIKPDFNLYKQPYKNMKDKRIQELYKRTGGAKSYDWKEYPQVKNKNKHDGGTGIVHPCEMPVEIMKWLVGIIPREYTIVDPFSGSGSTGVACVALDRDFIGMDIDEDYVTLGNARIKQFKELGYETTVDITKYSLPF